MLYEEKQAKWVLHMVDREPVELLKEGMMWSLEWVKVSNQAAVFCIYCSIWREWI